MDPWNQGQRMIGSHQNQMSGVPQNTNMAQNFFRPGNPQQFYPNQGGLPGHPGFQSGHHQPSHHQHGAMYQRNMNQMPHHHFPSGHATQAQPPRPLSQAEMDEWRKKKHFEEQQRRLLAMKQKGGQPGKTQIDNPLNDIFGKKGSTSNKSSLLGSFGEASKPKNHTPGFSTSASVIPNQTRPVFRNQNTAPALPNWNAQGTRVPSQNTGQNFGSFSEQNSTSSEPQTEHFDEFQSFTQAKPQDDFGDFQHSPANQSFGNSVQHPLPPTTTSNPPSSGGDTIIHPSTTTKVVNKEPSKPQAAATPSIEELMKKSLSLDNQSQGSTKKFQKPKLPKMIKSEPTHFTESAKASKWENLDSLSEVFTIPQAAVVQPEPTMVTHSDLVNTSSDDWSDFSGADQPVGLPPHGHGTTPLPQGSSEFATINPEPPNYGQSQFSGMSGGLSNVNCGAQPVPVPAWGTGTPGLPVPLTAYESPVVTDGMAIPTRNEHLSTVDDTSAQQQIEGHAEENVDPERQIYGVHLPPWSKETSLLPAVYKQVFEICSSDDGSISTSQLYPILLSSDLPRDKLGHIWTQCNKAVLGQLNERELYLILGMVALAQVGLQMNKLTLGKLTSCTTPPIPSFPEKIFQNDVESGSSVTPQEATNVNETPVIDNSKAYNSENNAVLTPTSNTSALSKHIDAVKQPDWSKWKTSKAGHIDDKFNDFQTLVPKDRSSSFQEQALSSMHTAPAIPDPMASFASFHGQAPSTSVGQTSNPPIPTKDNSGSFFITDDAEKLDHGDFGDFQTQGGQALTVNTGNTLPGLQSSTTADTFGDFTSVKPSEPQDSFVENKHTQPSSHVMSVPLQAAQRYTLTGEDENVDYHEKAWLKCLASCFAVITKSYQILQTITDPQLMNEIFSSQQGISHFSAIIEVYCVSQRVKTSVLRSAPNNMKLKESLQNIDNVWKTCLSFSSFTALLPSQSLNFSGCHVNENEDLNLTCGVCLLNVDKSWVSSLVNKSRSGKLSYGNRFYHTTCANFWCNKVDSVLPALQLNVGNSLI